MSVTFELTTTNTEIMIKDSEKSETLNLLKAPIADSLLVLEMKRDLLGRLNSTTLFNNLSTCADLFGIAYNAVNGLEGLQSAIWKLRQKLIRVASDSADDYVNGFINRINKVPTYYAIGVQALFTEPIDREKAKKAFSLISNEANEICKCSKELVDLFKGLSDEANDIAQKVIEAKSLDVTKKNQLEENIADLKAQLKGLETAQKNLEDEINELTDKYNELSKKIDKAENKAFWMGITSAITSAIGVGLSAFVSSTSAGMASTITKNITGGGNIQDPAAGQSESLKNTQKNLEDTNKKISETKATIERLKKEIDEKTKEIEAETNDENKKKLLDEKTALVAQYDQANSDLNTLNSEAKSYTEIIAGISAGLKDISGKLDAQGQKMEDTVSSLTQMADNISEKKSNLKKEKRDILQKIAEFTAKVENSVVSKNSLDLAIAALSAGIGAMNYIVSVLNDFYSFWINIKQYSENLANDETGTLIDLETEEQLHDIEFLSNVATNACQWVALKLVLIEYQNAFHNVYDKLQEQLREDEDPNPEVMWKRAIERSKGMHEIIITQAEGM